MRSGGDAGDGRVIRHIFGDDGTGTDHCVFAYGYTGDDGCVRADTRSFFYERWNDGPVFFRLRRAVEVGRTREFVVSKHHAVADEDVVLDGDAFAQKRVRRYLASTADLDSFLDLDECTDTRFVTDLAAVSVDEGVDLYIVTEFDIVEANEIFA